MLSRTVRATAMGCGRRMSGVATTTPGSVIATNVAIMEAMSKATDAAGLDAAKGASAAAAEAGAATATAEAYKPDPTAWQNMATGDFVAAEAGRSDFMPFIIGGVVTYLLLGVMLPAALPTEGKKTSKYYNMIQGNH